MKKEKERDHLKSVEITCLAPEAQEVLVGGTFNGWDPSQTPMRESADGIWRVMLQVPTGSYEYKFVVDGKWVCEPGVDEFDPKLVGSPDCVPNVFGSMNRKLQV
ncbi:MAG: glycoside hydrolase family 13 [Acidobacteria bacterium]|nr:glycoside hydrolase family 13 [Acidobacteriota bacterium]